MNIKYFVRTTGERVLDKSYEQIEYTLLIDKEHKPIQSFIDQLNIISEYNAVLLEDDPSKTETFEIFDTTSTSMLAFIDSNAAIIESR